MKLYKEDKIKLLKFFFKIIYNYMTGTPHNNKRLSAFPKWTFTVGSIFYPFVAYLVLFNEIENLMISYFVITGFFAYSLFVALIFMSFIISIGIIYQYISCIKKYNYGKDPFYEGKPWSETSTIIRPKTDMEDYVIITGRGAIKLPNIIDWENRYNFSKIREERINSILNET